MNTQHAEYCFLRDILIDLKRNYPEHNSKVLQKEIEHVNYQLETLGKNYGQSNS